MFRRHSSGNSNEDARRWRSAPRERTHNVITCGTSLGNFHNRHARHQRKRAPHEAIHIRRRARTFSSSDEEIRLRRTRDTTNGDMCAANVASREGTEQAEHLPRRVRHHTNDWFRRRVRRQHELRRPVHIKIGNARETSRGIPRCRHRLRTCDAALPATRQADTSKSRPAPAVARKWKSTPAAAPSDAGAAASRTPPTNDGEPAHATETPSGYSRSNA